MVKMTTLRLLLGLVATHDLELVQMDVKTTFVHGDLKEEIYMQPPTEFVQKDKEHLVCKLKKSIYGLKQAPKQWYQNFNTFMQSQGLKHSTEDPCLYVKTPWKGQLYILILYVDDMLIADIADLKKKLNSQFDMKDLGDANHILDMHITRDRTNKLLYLSQQEYVQKVLAYFNMQKGKSLSTPLLAYLKLNKEDCPKFNDKKAMMAKIYYALACGTLMCAMLATRSDICPLLERSIGKLSSQFLDI